MKNYYKIFFVAITFLFVAFTVSATTYPSTCPSEAQAIVGAVGGCGAIDSNHYSVIYKKCCSANTTQTQKTNVGTQTGNDKFLIDTLTTKYPNKETAPETASSMIVSILLSIACLFLIVFWIWMIIDVSRRKIPISQKILWLLVVIIFNWLGALIYSLVVRQPMIKNEKKN